MNELLSDSNTYVIIKNNPTKRMNEVWNLMATWLKKEYTDIHTYRKMLTTDDLSKC